MKSERRHELQHNDLAAWTIKTYEHVAPYRNAIIGATLLLVVGIVAWSIWRGHSEGQAAEGWNAIGLPGVQGNIQQLEKASADYKGNPAGQWAQVLAADTLLQVSESQGMEHKDVATQYCSFAVDRYEKTLAAPPPGYMARERAMFGKARALESLGKLEDAVRAYQDLNKEFPEGSYKAVADERLRKLDKPETAEFYRAFAQFTPKPTKESPRGKVDSLAPLPENPEEPPMPTPSVKPDGTTSGTAAAAPKTSAAPALPAVPKTEAPKSTAAAAPKALDTSKAPPAKKDK
jgi:hypothetical protein